MRRAESRFLGEHWLNVLDSLDDGLIVMNGEHCLEFMNEGNSFLVDLALVRVPAAAVAEAPHFDGHHWAEPSVNHLRMTMRAVFENREAARARGAIA